MSVNRAFGPLFLALLFFVCGCTQITEQIKKRQEANKKESTPKVETPLFPVEVVRPERHAMAAHIEPVGWVQAERRVEVMSKGMGECISLLVEEGDVVREGQVLAELDRAELQAQVKQSEITVRQNEYELSVAQKEAEAGSFAKHQANLKQFISEQAKATLDLQRIQLEHQTIRAPIGGIVTVRRVQKGMMISSGTPLFTVADPASYMLPIEVPERKLPSLRVGQEAQVRIDSQEGGEYTAKVRRVNPNVDAEKGTVKVVLDFADADREKLREGAFARVRLVMEVHENALTVPKDAIIEENARNYAMLVRMETPEEVQTRINAEKKPDKSTGTGTAEIAEGEQSQDNAPRLIAERVEVEKGLEDSSRVEVLSGIAEDAQVVVLGQHALKPGSAVSITTATEEMKAKEAKAREKAEGEAAAGDAPAQ